MSLQVKMSHLGRPRWSPPESPGPQKRASLALASKPTSTQIIYALSSARG